MSFSSRDNWGHLEEKRGHLPTSFSSLKLTRKNGKDSGYCSTPDQQVRLASHMIAHQRVYGIVSQLSREHQISRQSLYTLRAKGRKDMESVFCLEEQQTGWEVRIARAVLTLFAQGHASHEGIQHCIEEMLGEHVSLGTISAIIHEAG